VPELVRHRRAVPLAARRSRTELRSAGSVGAALGRVRLGNARPRVRARQSTGLARRMLAAHACAVIRPWPCRAYGGCERSSLPMHDTQIREHMPVVCSNEGQFATVDRVEGNAIKLTRDSE